MGCTGSKTPAEPAAEPTAEPVAESPSIGTLTYFAGLKSRGEPTQLCIAYGGLNMTVELIDFEEWGKRKGVISPFLPYITEPDGKVFGETEVIMKYLGEKAGMVVDEKQEELCKIANGAPIQIADPQYNIPDPTAFGAPTYDEWLPTALPVLKDYAAKLGDGPFFAGEKPGYAECFVWHNLDNCFSLGVITADNLGEDVVTKLTAFYDAFKVLPGISDYLAKRPTTWGMPGSKANPTA